MSQSEVPAFTADTAEVDDPLLDALVVLTRMHNNPCSAEALKAGLPLENNRLTPNLFVRAAARAGLSARLLKRPLKRISSLTLPAVLLTKDGDACILTSLSPCKVILPQTGDGEVEIAYEELEEIYAGSAILAKPAYRYDARTAETTTKSPRFWFWGTMLRSWPIYSEVMLASLMVNILTIATPLFIMNVYDRVVPNNAVETLWVLAAGIALVFGFDFLLKTLRGYFVDVAGKRADVILASLIYQRILGVQMSSHPPSTGAFANNLREFETLRDFFTSASLMAVIDLPFIFLFVFVIWLIGGDLAYIPLMAAPIVIIIGILLQIPLNRVIKEVFKESAQKHATLVESLNSLETIKALRAEGQLQGKWEQYVGKLAQSGMKARFLSNLTINFAALVQQASTVGIVVYGVYLIREGELTVGALVACTLLAGRALAPLGQVAGILTRFHQSMTALHALDKVIQLPQERPDDGQFLNRPDFDGSIEFRNVSFAYPNAQMEALSEVSFKIKAGERVAIIGRIGSGKSTLEKLILGMYQASDGQLLIDGNDIKHIDPADLRRNIGYVPQDITLFFGSLKENIRMSAPHADDSVILRAAQISGVDDFARTHPMGYDLPIGERGEGLSGGQQQAIAIARSLVNDPPILIMDEPSNAMDNSSEEIFKARLSQALPNKTLIVVTHRASLLSLVERIIVVDGGKVVADGPRDQVLKALSSERVKAAKG